MTIIIGIILSGLNILPAYVTQVVINCIILKQRNKDEIPFAQASYDDKPKHTDFA